MHIGELARRTGLSVRLAALEVATDPRPERYWQLMAVINGWPPIVAQTPNYAWLRDALRARA